MKNKFIYSAVFVLFSVLSFSLNAFAKAGEFQLSSHVLDISKGMPAENIEITLYKLDVDSQNWVKVSSLLTNKNGRVTDFLEKDKNNDGTYKLKFETAQYFKSQKANSIYPFVEVSFMVKGDGHYHIPITLSANGYSTYRGS